MFSPKKTFILVAVFFIAIGISYKAAWARVATNMYGLVINNKTQQCTLETWLYPVESSDAPLKIPKDWTLYTQNPPNPFSDFIEKKSNGEAKFETPYGSCTFLYNQTPTNCCAKLNLQTVNRDFTGTPPIILRLVMMLGMGILLLVIVVAILIRTVRQHRKRKNETHA